MNANDWIVEHGADKPEYPAEVGIPLYLPVPELPAEKRDITSEYEIDYTV